jgi:integrase
LEKASKTIIGKAAGVIVVRKSNKFASAHDLRRTFGAKWAKVVMPAVLQQLMHHESIETTTKYYAGLEAEEIADAAWDAAHAVQQQSLQQSTKKRAGD